MPVQERRTIFIFSQHQLVAILATAVDYCVMVAVVAILGLSHHSPVIGTALGSLFGAVTSFTLGRRWVFDARDGDWRLQALRYALVSGLSLLANAGGEALLVRFPVNYFIARVLVSVVVGMAWNYPMHRYYVFRMPPMGEQPDAAGCAGMLAAEPAVLSDDDAPPRTAPHRTS